jgi:O-antigen ligase
VIDSLLWAVPLAVLVAGARHPHWGLLVLLASLPLFGAPPGGPYLAALDVAALAALVTAWRGGSARPSRLDGGVVAFVAIGLLSLWPLAYLPPSGAPRHWPGLLAALPDAQAWGVLFTWRSAVDLLLGWGLFAAVRRHFAGRSLRPVGLAVAVGVAASLLLGFCEALGWLDLWSYRPIGLPLYDDRLHSLFFHSGWFAEYLVLATPFAVGALAIGGRASRGAGTGLAAAAGAARRLTQQRGGWLTGLAQLAVLAALALPAWRRADRSAFWRGVRRLAAVTIVAALLLAAALAVRDDMREGLEARLGRAVSDLSARTWVWRASVDLTLERPLVGWGLGIFSPLLDSRYPSKVNPGGHQEGWLTAHSLYFHLLIERGALGLLAGLWVVWLAVGAMRRQHRLGTSPERSLTAGLFASLVGFAVYGLVQYMFFLRSIAWLSWALLGAVAALPGAAAQVGSVGSARRRRLAWVLVGAALVAAVVRPYVWAPETPSRGTRTYGLHAPEITAEGLAFRWSDGRSAERLLREGAVLVLPLASGHPEGLPVDVIVTVDGRRMAERRLGAGWGVLRLPVPDTGSRWVLLEIEARPTFRPYRLPAPAPPLRSRDIRRLGVAVGSIGWEDGVSEETGAEDNETTPETSGAPVSASNQDTPSTTRSTVSEHSPSTSGH